MRQLAKMRSAKLKFCLICFSTRNIPNYSAVHFRFEELEYVINLLQDLDFGLGIYLFQGR